jgi:uncharacterized membrane protein YbhN (UPF0104 family)
VTLSGRKIPAWLVRLGQAGLSIGLLVLIWRAVDGAAAARSLAAAQWGWLMLGFVLLSLQTLLSALRWQLTARHLGIALGTRQALGEYYLSQVVNQSLPGGMIGDAGRAVRSRGGAGLMAAGQAVVFERLAGQIAMFATLGTAFVATLAVPGGLDWPGWLAAPVAGVLAVGFCLPIVAQGATHLPGPAGATARQMRADFLRSVAARPALVGQIVLSLGTTLCNLAAFAVCARAVGVDLGLSATAALVPLILFTMLLPVSISGWGLREGAAASLLPIAGVSASGGLAASIAFGLVLIAAVSPGLLLVWITPPREPQGTGQLTPP